MRSKRTRIELTKALGYPLACAAIASMTVLPVSAAAAEPDAPESAGDPADAQVQDGTAPVQAPPTKDETVYVHTTSDGTVTSNEVSAKLGNPDGASALADTTDLHDLKAEGDESTYVADGSSIVWSADGGDVSYRGATDRVAPVSLSVSYTLDGKPISPQDIAGKSGHVAIRYDYMNNSVATVNMNGSQQTVCTPFVVFTAVLLDGDVFSNVKVTNGRLVDDEGRMIVVGYAMPGLAESLELSGEDGSKVPSYVQIEADAEDFALGSALTMASPDLFGDLDLGIDAGELSDASAQLNDAMGVLEQGAVQLAASMGQLADGARAAKEGSASLAGGASDLSDAAAAEAAGVSALADGAAGLTGAADGLASGTQGVAKGAEALESSVKELDKQLSAVLQGDGSGGLESAVSDLAMLAQKAKALCDLLGASVADPPAGAPQGQVSGQAAEAADAVAAEAAKLASETDAAAGAAAEASALASQAAGSASGVRQALDGIDLSGIEDEAVRASVQAQVAQAQAQAAQAEGSAQAAAQAAAAAEQAASGIDASGVQAAAGAAASAAQEAPAVVVQQDGTSDEAKQAAAELYAGLAGESQKVAALVAGLQKIEGDGLKDGVLGKGGLPALVDGAQRVEGGAAELRAQVPQIVSGTADVAKGARALSAGTTTFATAATEYDSLMGTLSGGTLSAANGAGQLAAGLRQFGDEGLSRVTDAIDNKLVKFANRYDAVVQAGRDYTNFSGIAPGTSGTVKFVIETDAIT